MRVLYACQTMFISILLFALQLILLLISSSLVESITPCDESYPLAPSHIIKSSYSINTTEHTTTSYHHSRNLIGIPPPPSYNHNQNSIQIRRLQESMSIMKQVNIMHHYVQIDYILIYDTCNNAMRVLVGILLSE